MSQQQRRVFLIAAAATGLGFAAGARAQVMVDEKDPQAVALGYVADTAKADAKKFPQHKPDQHCANCALYQGEAGKPGGNCPLFAGKQVAANGWCSAWAKKA